MDALSKIFLFEILGTGMLTLLGCGVVANVALARTKGLNGGFLMVNIGWGFAVFAGVTVAYGSGAHLNPAVTFGLLIEHLKDPSVAFAKGIDANVGNMFAYFAAQMIGAFLGAVLCWAAYKQHFDIEEAPETKLAVFSTGPAVRNSFWNFVTEAIGTFVLVFVVIAFGRQGEGALSALGALPVALLVIVIGTSLGGPTGYAINPARDLGPRIAHAVLPIKGKGSSDWGYSWVPIVGPLVGGGLAGLAGALLLPVL